MTIEFSKRSVIIRRKGVSYGINRATKHALKPFWGIERCYGYGESMTVIRFGLIYVWRDSLPAQTVGERGVW